MNTVAEMLVQIAAIPVTWNALSQALQKRTGANHDGESERGEIGQSTDVDWIE